MPSLIGNKINQVPTNGDLGTLAFQDSNAVNITGGVVDVSAGTAALPTLGTTGDPNTGVFFPAADTVAVATNGAEALRIDASGNVGIGTTPADKLHVNGNIYLGTANRTIYTGGSGNLILQNNTGVTIFGRANGASESMRIDAGGNLGIGITAPTNKLHVYDANVSISMNEVAAGGTGVASSRWKFSTNHYGIYVGSVNAMVFYDYGASAERMRIDSAGNIGIGTSSPATKLDVNGAIFVAGNVKLTNANATNVSLFNTAASAINYGLYSANTAANGFNGFGILDITNSVYRLAIGATGGVSIGNTTDRGAASLNVSGLIFPQQATTAAAPAYVKGAIYFDTTLNKLRVGGATAWETITSV